LREKSVMTRTRLLRVAAAAVTVCTLVGACGSGSTPGSGGKITLTLNLFGNFGYKDLYAKYQAEHPNIKIEERTAAYNDHHQNLATHLATGSGAADIEGVDTGFISRFKDKPQQFVNLNDYGAAQLKDRWLPWKWQASVAKTGEQIGYGTDVGGLAICYRRDLFQQAGLPTARDQVAKLWPTWADYIKTGQTYMSKAPVGTSFYDGAGQLFNAIIGQAATGYYDTTDKLIVGANPEVRKAWDLATQSVKLNESAKLVVSSQEWNTGFTKSQFATIACPAWMTTMIKDQAKAFAGQWDVTSVPGNGGNWGGSYLTVPKQGKHIKEAVALAAWLTAPEQQSQVFTSQGNLPSTPALYDQSEIATYKSEFFNNAPVGQLFTTAAKKLAPQYQGPRAGDIQTTIRDALVRIEQGKQTPDDSWTQMVGDVARLAK
jgi:cellobiose transport system substrate-binding protein